MNERNLYQVSRIRVAPEGGLHGRYSRRVSTMQEIARAVDYGGWRMVK